LQERHQVGRPDAAVPARRAIRLELALVDPVDHRLHGNSKQAGCLGGGQGLRAHLNLDSNSGANPGDYS
jgi:hypothetical protein